jgi:putative phosphoribosyl transferase
MSQVEQGLEITVAGVTLQADLVVPDRPVGLIVFAHGSGSGRHSSRNRYVARELHQVGLATALADLLTPDEELADARGGQFRFDIGRLSVRVIALTDWLRGHDASAGLDVGLFGASTGAAAALVAAAARPSTVEAVVSRGGRPDLAGEFLRLVFQPTLLIVGGNDPSVVELNRNAAELLPGQTRLDIVPGATHLFEEAGALEQVAQLARDWFLQHLGIEPGRQGGRRSG